MIEIGCNIHDNMLAFIFVTRAQVHAVSGKDGTVGFSELAAGRWIARFWHPDIRAKTGVSLEFEVSGSSGESFAHVLDLRKRRSVQQPPSDLDDY